MFFSDSITPFCEGRLYGAEYFNTGSSFIMFIWSMFRLRHYAKTVRWGDFINLFNILSINCMCSALFHGTLWMGFKLFDEISMIIPLWSGILIFLKLLASSRNEYIFRSYVIHLLNLSIIVFNCFMSFQWLFPVLFTVEILSIILLYNTLSTQYDDSSKKGKMGIYICCASGIIWWITEQLCTPYMKYGHALWHIGMPLGVDFICQYILTVKEKKYKDMELHKIMII